MLRRLKSAVSGAVEGLDSSRDALPKASDHLPHKHKYARPAFLNLSNVADSISRDKKLRPVLSASSRLPLPYYTGYAECINAGKSNLNEDMAQINHSVLRCQISEYEEAVLPYAYYGIFDGHAGYGAALDASKQLHHIIHQKLVDAMDVIFASLKEPPPENLVDRKSIIIGCLETSFCEMDDVIKESGHNYYNPGGCTAIVALFILGDVYVANAGDCRAGICDNGEFIPMSNDFSPYYDKCRIYRKAYENAHLLGDRYTVREFFEFPTSDDLGKNVLYKDPYMSGWSYKTLTPSDLKYPLITGIGRRSRIMGTIGVARGFGDFDLTANHYKIPIKPFLSCVPEVKVYSQKDLVNTSAVLVMASDGLWDAVDTEDVAEMCCDINTNIDDRNRHVTLAMNLLAAARGRKDINTNAWILKNSSTASLDDISVFVIPFEPYFYKECEIISCKPGKTIYPSMEIPDSDSGSDSLTQDKIEEGDDNYAQYENKNNIANLITDEAEIIIESVNKEDAGK